MSKKIGKDVTGRRNKVSSVDKNIHEFVEEQKAKKEQERLEKGKPKEKSETSQVIGSHRVAGELPPEDISYEIEERTRKIRRKKP